MAQSISKAPASAPLRIWVISAIVLLATILVASSVLLTYQVVSPPDNARIIVDEQSLTYASPPCLVFNKLDRELIGNRNEVNDPSKPLQLLPYASEKVMADLKDGRKWNRDATCDFATGFDQIVTLWMRLVGYRSRWSDDGHWRW